VTTQTSRSRSATKCLRRGSCDEHDQGVADSCAALQTTSRILATATRLFLEEGIQAACIDRVIAAADVALMTVYRQFGGKDELVAAALKQWSDHRLHWLKDRLDQCGDDPQARFTGLWDAIEEWLDSEQFRASLVANAAAELRSKPHHPAMS
jgi:AcrR family transcriptional regulator